MPIDTDYAYLAGLIDGEGTFSITLKQTRNWHQWDVNIRIALTRISPLEWCASTFGGRVQGPYNPKNPKHAPYWYWRIGGDKACDLAKDLLPFLKLKDKHADILATYLDEKLSLKRTDPGPRVSRTAKDAEHDRREGLMEQMRQLNHRGV